MTPAPRPSARRARLIAVIGTGVYATLLGGTALTVSGLAAIAFLFASNHDRMSVFGGIASLILPVAAGMVAAVVAMWWLLAKQRFHLVAWALLLPVAPAAFVWTTYDPDKNSAVIRAPSGPTCNVQCYAQRATGETELLGEVAVPGIWDRGICRLKPVTAGGVPGASNAKVACNARYERCFGICWAAVDAGQ